MDRKTWHLRSYAVSWQPASRHRPMHGSRGKEAPMRALSASDLPPRTVPVIVLLILLADKTRGA